MKGTFGMTLDVVFPIAKPAPRLRRDHYSKTYPWHINCFRMDISSCQTRMYFLHRWTWWNPVFLNPRSFCCKQSLRKFDIVRFHSITAWRPWWSPTKTEYGYSITSIDRMCWICTLKRIWRSLERQLLSERRAKHRMTGMTEVCVIRV